MQKLPLGISTFRTLRESNCLYVDKTEYAYNLITKGWRYFLARPRRFGKSLFVSTLKEILSGNKSLFDGLWISASDYQWQEYGVIALDLSNLGIYTKENLKNGIISELKIIAEYYNVTIATDGHEPSIVLADLVRKLHKKFGKVAILIDEYDSPILHVLEDEKAAREIRDSLSLFFKTIKGLDAYVNFTFLTGVTSFSKAGVFSGLNNLETITLLDSYGAILGYTDKEVDQYFKDYIQDWSEKKNIPVALLRQEIKDWYNGYRFAANAPLIYNPYSLLFALKQQNFKNFWIDTGTPTFLIKEITKEYRQEQLRIFDPENLELSEDSLGVIDIGAIPLPTLIFQTGYLTIDSYNPTTRLYKLKLSNQEIKQSFQQLLFNTITNVDSIASQEILRNLVSTLNKIDVPEMVRILQQLFSRIPHQLHMPQERFYHAILQIIFDLAGIRVQSEYSTSHGRIDIVLELPKLMYVIEIKLNQPAEVALAQIEERRYYEPFLKYGKPIQLLGLSFERAPQQFNITYVMKGL